MDDRLIIPRFGGEVPRSPEKSVLLGFIHSAYSILRKKLL